MYKPYVTALSECSLMPLPDWRVGAAAHENWRASAGSEPHALSAITATGPPPLGPWCSAPPET
jgi:hypothetical protein